VEEASRRDFSLKPREADDTIIALAIAVATVLVVAPRAQVKSLLRRKTML
jgi:hypothetical protein